MEREKELDGFAVAGGILNIIFASLLTLSSFGAFAIGVFYILIGEVVGIGISILGLVFGVISVLTLVYNAKFLYDGGKYKKEAVVFGFICLSIIGSVLIIISKEKDKLHKDSLFYNLNRAKELFEDKVINEEEYERLKKMILFK